MVCSEAHGSGGCTAHTGAVPANLQCVSRCNLSVDGVQAKHVAVEAAQRALALFQALGNLHCFSPTSSPPRLRHRFARLLAAQLRGMGAPHHGYALHVPCSGRPARWRVPGARRPALLFSSAAQLRHPCCAAAQLAQCARHGCTQHGRVIHHVHRAWLMSVVRGMIVPRTVVSVSMRIMPG